MHEYEKEKLESFLKRWPIKAIKNMELQDYISTGVTAYDTFAYWIEYATRCLGNVGSFATKFGIYQQYDVKDNLPNGCEKDKDNYVWHTWLAQDNNGNDKGLKGAFEYVKQDIILPIAINARKGIFNDKEIEEKNCVWGIIKWKIAFLYQDFDNIQILPIYSWEKLAKYLKVSDKSKTMLDLYKIAIKQKKIKNFDDALNFASRVFPKKTLLIDSENYVQHHIPNKREKSKNPPVISDKPYSTAHSDMQNKLKSFLESTNWTVILEATHRNDKSQIDLVAKKGNEKNYYEIKPYKEARECIREALGQLIEYWYYGKSDKYKKANKLFIVGPSELNELDDIFLNKLRIDNKIPIYYLLIEP